MGSAVVYIIYALDDYADVSKIANAIKKSGWSICYGHTADPGIDQVLNQERHRSADCVLVIWSANAAGSSVLRSDALEAAAHHKLVQVSLDDAAPPARNEPTVRLRDWCDGGDEGCINALIAEITDHAGPGKGRGRVIPYAGRRLPDLPWLKGAAFVFGGIAVALILVMGMAAFKASDRNLAVGSSFAHQSPALGPVGVTGAAALKDEPLRSTTAPAQPDTATPILRGLSPVGDRPPPAAALSAAQTGPEELAWQGILEQRDLPTQAKALAIFRDTFAVGVHRFDAARLQGEQEAILHKTRMNLVFLGFLPSLGGNDLPELRAAVEAFETSIGLRATGTITEDLADALAEAARAKGG